MTNLLITGGNSSLGKKLLEMSPYESTCYIDSIFMFEKYMIDNEIKSIINSYKYVTHVINNWGINYLSNIGDTSNSAERILQHNIMGPYWIINELVRLNQTCRVINVASATYRVPQRCTSLYCASKAALVQMTKVMARELAPKGWVINCIAPGKIEDTKMAEMTDAQVLELRGWTKEYADEYALSQIPMGRFTNTKEVAEAIYKIFELPDYINGAVIDMMGGV